MLRHLLAGKDRHAALGYLLPVRARPSGLRHLDRAKNTASRRPDLDRDRRLGVLARPGRSHGGRAARRRDQHRLPAVQRHIEELAAAGAQATKHEQVIRIQPRQRCWISHVGTDPQRLAGLRDVGVLRVLADRRNSDPAALTSADQHRDPDPVGRNPQRLDIGLALLRGYDTGHRRVSRRVACHSGNLVHLHFRGHPQVTLLVPAERPARLLQIRGNYPSGMGLRHEVDLLSDAASDNRGSRRLGGHRHSGEELAIDGFRHRGRFGLRGLRRQYRYAGALSSRRLVKHRPGRSPGNTAVTLRLNWLTVDLQDNRANRVGYLGWVWLLVGERPVELGSHAMLLALTRLRRGAADVHDRSDPAGHPGAEQLGAGRERRFGGPEEPAVVPGQSWPQEGLDQAFDPLGANLCGKVDRVGDEDGAAFVPGAIEVQVARLVLAFKVLLRDQQQRRIGWVVFDVDVVNAPLPAHLNQVKAVLGQWRIDHDAACLVPAGGHQSRDSLARDIYPHLPRPAAWLGNPRPGRLLHFRVWRVDNGRLPARPPPAAEPAFAGRQVFPRDRVLLVVAVASARGEEAADDVLGTPIPSWRLWYDLYTVLAGVGGAMQGVHLNGAAGRHVRACSHARAQRYRAEGRDPVAPCNRRSSRTSASRPSASSATVTLVPV